MDTHTRKTGGIAILLSAFMLLQSCVVYHKTPSTLEEASQARMKTKVTLTNGTEIKFKSLTKEEGQYFGTQKVSGEMQQILVRPEDVRNVQLKNKTASTFATIGAIVVPIVGFILIGNWIIDEKGLGTGLEFN